MHRLKRASALVSSVCSVVSLLVKEQLLNLAFLRRQLGAQDAVVGCVVVRTLRSIRESLAGHTRVVTSAYLSALHSDR